jgi:hypothetical protein
LFRRQPATATLMVEGRQPLDPVLHIDGVDGPNGISVP